MTLVVLLITGFLAVPASEAAPKKGVLTEVADGDTVTVEFKGGREASVRLIGIDTPELAHFGEPEECGGPRAKAALERFEGGPVRLRLDPTQAAVDRYGRLLRYLDTVRGGRDIGRSQITRGLAEPYVYDDPFERLGSYEASAQQARESGRGLWSACGGDFHRPK